MIRPTFRRGWRWLLLAGLALEAWALVRTAGGDTLSEFVRRHATFAGLPYRIAVCALLTWLLWHWVRPAGVDWRDLVAVGVGVLWACVTWRYV